jgi:membrane protein implicated in regulation of membrane protease activity
MRDLVLLVLAVIAAVLAFLWWRPVQRWALGIDELEQRIEALEHRLTLAPLRPTESEAPL